MDKAKDRSSSYIGKIIVASVIFLSRNIEANSYCRTYTEYLVIARGLAVHSAAYQHPSYLRVLHDHISRPGSSNFPTSRKLKFLSFSGLPLSSITMLTFSWGYRTFLTYNTILQPPRGLPYLQESFSARSRRPFINGSRLAQLASKTHCPFVVTISHFGVAEQLDGTRRFDQYLRLSVESPTIGQALADYPQKLPCEQESVTIAAFVGFVKKESPPPASSIRRSTRQATKPVLYNFEDLSPS